MRTYREFEDACSFDATSQHNTKTLGPIRASFLGTARTIFDALPDNPQRLVPLNRLMDAWKGCVEAAASQMHAGAPA